MDDFYDDRSLRENAAEPEKSFGSENTLVERQILGRIDQYELIRELGGGGFGTVYLARDTVSGVEVAVKGLPPAIKNNLEELENIRANFALVQRLHHPNIAAALVLHQAAAVDYSDAGTRDKLRVLPGETLLVMQYAPGVTLSQWRKQFPGRKVPLEKALDIVSQIASALDYAHSQKIIHRDIKPSNVVVETRADGSAVARILDFGLAAEVHSSMSRISKEVCDVSGTRPYMAPEQWLGRRQGPATDQYALAALFHELVTGEVPFSSVFDTGDPVVMMNVVGREVFAAAPELPKPVRLALCRALAKNPEERFAACGDFAAALGGAKAKPAGGHRLLKGVAALWAAAAVAAAGVTAWQWHARRDAARREAENLARAEYAAETNRLAEAVSKAAATAAAAWNGTEPYRLDPEGLETQLSELSNLWAGVSAEWRPDPDNAAVSLSNRLAEVSAAAEAIASVSAKMKPLSEARERVRLERRRELDARAKEEAAKDAAKRAKEAQERAAELVRLKTRLNIKRSDAEAKMRELDGYRAAPEGLEGRIASADGQWKTLKALPEPESLEQAETALDMADKAETQISLDLAWLRENKAGRDAAKAAVGEISAILRGDAADFNAEKYAAGRYGEAARLREAGDAAFKRGDFAAAGKSLAAAREKFADAAREARDFCVKTRVEAAREYFKAGKWKECIAEADKALEWAPGNDAAARLKKDAEDHLVPTAELAATVDGREVQAEVTEAGRGPRRTPAELGRLTPNGRIGPFKFTHAENGRRYEGTIDELTVDWRGPKRLECRLQERKEPRAGDVKTVIMPGGAAMEMVWCPAGSFMMGSDNGGSDEKPAHRVTISKGFWIGKYPVTQAQWASMYNKLGPITGSSAEPSCFSASGGGKSAVSGMDTSRFPVERVSWDDCDQMVELLNRAQSECVFALPTEAQWEYAARGGPLSRGYTYSGGNYLDRLGWYYENSGRGRLDESDWDVKKLDSNGCRTHRVDEKDVGNELGIVGMSGNVWEWCRDWYDGDYYSRSPETDPCNTASGVFRVLRGGCWRYRAGLCRSAYRSWGGPGARFSGGGFRLVCSAGPRE